MNILLLEDDFVLSNEIKIFFEHHLYPCDCVYDGQLLLKQYYLKEYDLLILDINVPGMNGFQAARSIREINKHIPILMLTAYGEMEDKINAYNHGADDYLVKPFHFDELLLRTKSLLRRKSLPQIAEATFKIDTLVINFDEKKVCRSDVEISLTPKEFQILVILAKAHGKVISKNQIAENLWDTYIKSNTIEVYINFLRNKIDKDFETKLIHTKAGYGYYLKSGN